MVGGIRGQVNERMEIFSRNLLLDDARTESILREHLKLPQELWDRHQHHEVYLTGEEAVKCGLATELGEFSPPPDAKIYKV
jgi:ATP-dependent Clp protease, protease subunit